MSISTFSIDRKNVLLIGSVLVFMGIIGVWIPYERTKNLPLPTTPEADATVVIEYRETGFVPPEVTVTVGTTVEWQNPLGRPLWVASDPHPSHTNLEGFDQRGVSAQTAPRFTRSAHAHGSEAYSYTFTKVGVWNYHNHLYPQDRGTVIVISK